MATKMGGPIEQSGSADESPGANNKAGGDACEDQSPIEDSPEANRKSNKDAGGDQGSILADASSETHQESVHMSGKPYESSKKPKEEEGHVSSDEQVGANHHKLQETSPLAEAALSIPVLLLAVLLYIRCVFYSEWYIDELFAVVRNADARGDTPLLDVLRHDFWGNPITGGWTHKSYRPLVVMSYWFQFLFNGGEIKPQPLRAFDVAVHAVNSLLLLLLLRKGMRFSRTWSCLSACLFAAHPVHVESVVYLVGRADMLATTCWLMIVLAYSKRPTSSWIAKFSFLCLILILTILGGFCKESGFTVLFYLAATELLGPAPLRSVVLLGCFGLVFMARSWITDGTAAGFSFVDTPVQYNSDKLVRTLTYLYHHMYYAKLLLLPWPLCWDYTYDSLPLLKAKFDDVRILGILAAYLSVVALAAWGLRGSVKRVLLGLGTVIVPFIPASNLFFVVGVTVGERLLYPCTVGSSIIIASLGEHIARRMTSIGRVLLLINVALLGVYIYKCDERVRQWGSRETLFKADVDNFPASVKTHHQIGTIYHKIGRFDEALYHFNASLQIFDDNALTDYCIAQIFIETGKHQEAIQRFEKIMAGHGIGFGGFNTFALYTDFGFTLTLVRRFDEAIEALKLGLKMNEDVPHALNALGYSLAHLNKHQEAQDAFVKGLEYDPENGFLWNNLGVLWLIAGEPNQAAQALEKAIMIEQHPTFLRNGQLLQSWAKTGQFPQGANPNMELFFHRVS